VTSGSDSDDNLKSDLAVMKLRLDKALAAGHGLVARIRHVAHVYNMSPADEAELLDPYAERLASASLDGPARAWASRAASHVKEQGTYSVLEEIRNSRHTLACWLAIMTPEELDENRAQFEAQIAEYDRGIAILEAHEKKEKDHG